MNVIAGGLCLYLCLSLIDCIIKIWSLYDSISASCSDLFLTSQPSVSLCRIHHLERNILSACIRHVLMRYSQVKLRHAKLADNFHHQQTIYLHTQHQDNIIPTRECFANPHFRPCLLLLLITSVYLRSLLSSQCQAKAPLGLKLTLSFRTSTCSPNHPIDVLNALEQRAFWREVFSSQASPFE